ncbi:tail fiber protein [Pseudomonas sp. 3A(2025)]
MRTDDSMDYSGFSEWFSLALTDSPTLTGVPRAPTAIAGSNSTQLATTAFVQAALSALVGSAPEALNQLNELAAALGNDANFSTSVINMLAAKAPLLSPTLTGNPKAPTPEIDDNDTSIATTAFVQAVLASLGIGPSLVNSNTLATGTDLNTVLTYGVYAQPLVANATLALNYPKATAGTLTVKRGSGTFVNQQYQEYNTGQVWTRSIHNGVASSWLQSASVDSPVFSGDPKAPTPAITDNDTSIATTAFVQALLASLGIAPGSTNSNTLAAGTDLNTVLTYGVYAQPLVANATLLLNYPKATAGTLTVKRGSGTFVNQQYHEYNTGQVWTRSIHNGAASPWVQSASVESPALSGTPTAPTAAVGTDSSQLATMAALLQGMAAFGVGAQVAPLISDLDTLAKGGLYRANSDAANLPFPSSSAVLHLTYSNAAAVQIVGVFSSTANARLFWRGSSSSVWSSWREVGKLDSPALTGTPTAPTADVGTNTSQLATTAHVRATLASIGLGATGEVTVLANLDATTTESGFYKSNSTATTGTFPVGVSSFAHILVERYNAGALKQTFTPVGNVTGAGTVWTRVCTTSTGWSDWQCSANLNSPALTGTPTAPTAVTGTSNTQLATTAFVQAAVAALVGSAPSTLNQLSELAAALGNDANFSTTILSQLSGKAPLVSPALNGTPTAPTAAVGTSTTQLATTAFVQTLLSSVGLGNKAPNVADLNVLRGACFFGFSATAAGAVPGTGYDAIGWQVEAAGQRTQFAVSVHGTLWFRTDDSNDYSGFTEWASLALSDSPTFTGVPKAPTPAVGDSGTAIATTSFVQQALAAFGMGTSTAPLVSDCDSLTTSGFYFTSTTSTANTPLALNGFLLHTPWNGTSAMLQIYATASADRFFWRTKSSGTWRAWKESANLDSPAFSGVPSAPTAAVGTNSTQLATMAALQQGLAANGLGVIGNTVTVTNVDDYTQPTGLWRTIGGTTPTTGTFPAGISAYGTLFIERYSTTGVKQTFSPNANAAGAGTTWERFYTSTGWLEWVEVIKRTSKLDASMIDAGMLPPARLEHITGGSDWIRLNGDPNSSEVGGSIRIGSSGTPYITLNGTTILAWGSSGELLTGSVPWSKITGGPSEAGMVSMFAMASAPNGYLKANGAAVSRTTYSVLFAAIGTTYGTGNGSTTFNLPDLRAEFIRGLDDGRNIDTGRVIGSAQGSQNAEHNHVASSSSSGAHTHTVNVKGDRASGEGNQVYGDEDFYKDPLNLPTTSAGAHTHTISVSPSGGPEARPRNIALLACIRYL